ncbi:hypothetical protein [Manganibacter manganicus]|uniref:hypothetical protein n=1 Tax=Manganibacter manganicus TaxID=1873176 RepID=UPI0011180748|nr:hypothetical protein [Pseudaminobacter manganicus]
MVVSDVTKNEPVAAYGRSKREAEEHVAKLAERGVLAISLRPPLVVGADAKGNWAGLQKLAATGIPLPFGGIHNERSFIGVWSLAEMIAHLCRSDWHSELSGNYCVADPGFLSLPDIVTELRSGMGIPARLFSVPSAIFDWAGALSGRRRQFAGLTGNLRVDPSRFLERFGFKPALPVREAIRHSGADYISGAKGGAR